MHTILPFVIIFARLMQTISRSVNKKSLSKREAFGVVLSGFEPPTHGFSVRCSTN